MNIGLKSFPFSEFLVPPDQLLARLHPDAIFPVVRGRVRVPSAVAVSRVFSSCVPSSPMDEDSASSLLHSWLWLASKDHGKRTERTNAIRESLLWFKRKEEMMRSIVALLGKETLFCRLSAVFPLSPGPSAVPVRAPHHVGRGRGPQNKLGENLFDLCY